MHELSIIIEVVKSIDKIAKEQNLTKVDTLVLQIGELSSVVPRYVEDCYPAAIDGTFMEKTKLKIEIIKGIGKCKECNKEFNVIKNKGYCPKCKKRDFHLISGKEFLIKEIVAY